jgi:hypothetical protein
MIDRPLVCILGTLRCLESTASNLSDNVIQALDADMAICVSRMSPEDEKLLHMIDSNRVVATDIYDDAKIGYENLFDEDCRKRGRRNGLYELCRIEGNWLGGLAGRNGSGMHLNYNYRRLLKLLREMWKSGRRYKRYIVTRSDFLWTFPHPPMSALGEKRIWIPSGQDWGGCNDRHAVCSNTNVETYLGLYESMMDMKVMKYIRNIETPYQGVNHELQLFHHLNYHGARIGRFKNAAYLTWDQGASTNWGSFHTIAIDGCEHRCKYPDELLTALAHKHEHGILRDWRKMTRKEEPLAFYRRIIKSNLNYRILNRTNLADPLSLVAPTC